MSAPDWRELSRRLYVELFYCNQQMTSERQKWKAGASVLNVLAEAKALLDATPSHSPAAAQVQEAAAQGVEWNATTSENPVEIVPHPTIPGALELRRADSTRAGGSADPYGY